MKTTKIAKTTYTQDEVITIASNMIQYGGGFISNIGKALLKADVDNTNKILDNWSNESERFLNMGS